MLLSISGTLALAASLSEMASICPVAGAQYQWTYMFAPEKSKAFITRMQGERNANLDNVKPETHILITRLDHRLRLAGYCDQHYIFDRDSDPRLDHFELRRL
jgi:hypothetical protein